MQQLNDSEYKVVQLKRRIAELKERIGYTSGNVKPDQNSAEPKTSNHDQSNRSADAQDSYSSLRASELNNLKNQLRKRT